MHTLKCRNAKLNEMKMQMFLYIISLCGVAICLLLRPSKRKYIKISSGKTKDYFRLPASALLVSFNVKNGYNVQCVILEKIWK